MAPELKHQEKHETQRVWAMPPAILLIIMAAFFLGLFGMNQKIVQASDRFSGLVQEGKYSEAEALYIRTCGFLPHGAQEKALLPFRKGLETEIDRLAKDYMNHKVPYDTVKSRFQAIERIGLNPGNLEKCRAIIIAQELSNESKEQQAISVIQNALLAYPGDPLLTQKLAEYKTRANQLAAYDGPVQHIFFHPLIAYPELAFDNDYISRGLNEFFVTVKEFNRILEALYKNDYILVDVHSIFEERVEGGKKILVRKQMMLPRGKKPLILSIDDLNYYPYMLQNGMSHKLVLDAQGDVAAYSLSPAKKEVISKNNEIIPILNEFVREHPDFSHKGAKGIIALTGFNGVLGYRTDDMASPAYAAEKKEALAVIKRLKDTGWAFASHGYGHLDTKKRSLNELVNDTRKWKDEVEPLTGPTDVYIYPYGSSVPPTDPKFQHLQQAGFKVFCAVGPREYSKYNPEYILMDRRHIDGIALCKQAATLQDLFDSQQVVDRVRPPL